MFNFCILSCLVSLASLTLTVATPLPQYNDGYGSCVPPNLIQNGDFESLSNEQCGSGQSNCDFSMATIAPWTITSSPYSTDTCRPVLDDTAWPAASGTKSVNLNKNCSPYSLNQQVQLTVGKKYILEMKTRSNTNCYDANPKQAFIQASGSSEFVFDLGPQQTSWIPMRYEFTATESNVLMTIGSKTHGTNCGPVIDDVRLTMADFCANPLTITTTTTTTSACTATTMATSTYSLV